MTLLERVSGNGFSKDFSAGYAPLPALRLAVIRSWLTGVILAIASPVGVAQVALPNGAFEESAVEMRIKVVGGSFDLKREYLNGAWQINPHLNKLKFEFDPLDGTVKIIDRNGSKYEERGDAWVFDVHNLMRARQVLKLLPTTSEGIAPSALSGATPEATAGGGLATTTIPGYRWNDRRGNWIDYDDEGRPLSYGNRNNVRVWFQYAAEGGALERVRDHFGRTIVQVSGGAYRDNPAFIGGSEPQRTFTLGADGYTNVLGDSPQITYAEVAIDQTGTTINRERRPSIITDPEGRTRKITYISGGRISKVEYPDGSTTDYVYGFDKLKKEFSVRLTSRAAGGATAGQRIAELRYDEKGRLIQRDINGETLYKLKRLDARNWEVTDIRGLKTLETWDEFENVIKTVFPDGAQTSARYDPVYSNILEYVDELGVKTRYEYDTRGNLTRRTDAVGTAAERVAEYTYDSFGYRLTNKGVADAKTVESTVQYQYDNRGALTQFTDAEGHVSRYEYDIRGALTKTTDARNQVWTWAYDARGDLLSKTAPTNHTVAFARNKLGSITKFTDARGKERTYAYDALGRQTQSVDPLGHSASVAYDFLDNPTVLTDKDGRTARMTYDGLSRVASVADGKGNTIGYTYAEEAADSDPGYKPSRISFPTYEQRFDYDARGRAIQSTAVLGEEARETGYGYTQRGELSEATDAYGRSSTLEYDALGNVVRVEDRLGGGVAMTYDDRGNLLTVTDSRNGIWQFEYDKANRQTKQTDPLGKVTQYRYDANGNRSETLMPRGHRITNAYDDSGRLTETKAYDTADVLTQTVTFSYDANSNLTGWTDLTGGTSTGGTRTYDDLNRLLSETINHGATSLAYSYTYYPSGLVKTLTYPNGFTLTYGYDAHGGLQQIDVPGQGSITVNDWKWIAPTKVTLPGGTVREEGYDGLLQLTSLKIKSPGQQTLTDLGNGYGKLGELQSRSLDGQASSYDYDVENRLTQVQGPNRSYTLDANGNRIADSAVSGEWTYNLGNQLLQKGSISYEYDDAGNLIRKTDAALSEPAKTTTYGYDSFNRLTEIRDGNNATIAQYTYDPFNRRLSKTVGAQTTFFLHGREGLLAEADSSGAVTVLYGWHPGTIYSTSPLFIKRAEAYGYFHTDHLGTPIRATNQQGDTVWSASYDAFGEATISPTSTLEVNLRLPGQYLDHESGLHYNWNRYYDPNTGRYISSDPIGLAAGTNTYAYVGGNPVSFSDPMGLYWFRQDWHTKYVVGRERSTEDPSPLVVPGDSVSQFIENYVPAGRTFGEMHDAFVDMARNAGFPDELVNIPSMPSIYVDAVIVEILRSLEVLDQPAPSCQ